MNQSNIGYAAAVLSLSLSSAACSAVSTAAAPPTVADASGSAAPCRVTGRPTVLARHLFVPGGVEVQENGGALQVRFAHAKSRCLTTQWPPTSEAPQDAACPSPGATVAANAVSGDETMLASERVSQGSGNAPLLVLGIVTYDPPHADFGFSSAGRERVVERLFAAERVAGDQTSPELVAIGGERFLLVWVEGGVERHELRAQSVAGWGDRLGPAMDLSTADVSVIGRASAVVGPDGDGLVAYIASAGEEFDLFGTPIACAAR